jgi:hypothetical protein
MQSAEGVPGKRNPSDSADQKFKEGRQEVMWSAKRDSSTIATWMEQRKYMEVLAGPQRRHDAEASRSKSRL